MSKILWSKSESREVRPFFSVEDFQKALDAAEIRLFEGQAFSASEAFVLQHEELLRVHPEIRLNFSIPVLKGNAYHHQDLTLIVCLAAANLKKTKTIAKFPLDQELPESVTIDPETILALGGGENLVVKLGVCLNKELKPEIGRPFLEGHWIARKSFRLRSTKQTNQFEVQPRSDAEWRQHGFPEKTLYLVSYTGGMNEAVEKGSPIAQVWVHEDMYNRLALDTESKKARAFMSFLSAEITLQLIAQSYPDWKEADAVAPASPLGALVKQLSTAQKIDLSRLKQMVEEPGQPKLKAVVHNQQHTVRALVEA